MSNIGLGGAVKWLTGPTGRVVVALALFGAWTGYQRADAAHEAREAVWAEVAEEYERQQAEAALLQAEARQRADAAEARLEELTRAKDAILDTKDDESCDIPADVRDRLRAIR
ncbi:MAG: hypothetical protein LC676_08890 [Loktanella sp.]|nr:hypothetical protein [Loktanella sp.]